MSNRSGKGEIWMMPAAGGTPAQVTEGPGYAGYPKWSPDGSQIAFSSSRSGNHDIWVVDVPSAGVRPAHESSWSRIKAMSAE